jgi:hypothetical protein
MAKKSIIVLALVILIGGTAFAEPSNTLTVDIGPTIFGAAFSGLGKSIYNLYGDPDEIDFNASGWGIAAQYEHQFNQWFSLAGRFAYAKATGDVTKSEEIIILIFPTLGTATADIDISSISAEAHFRVYPFGGFFFLDAMLGYGNMTADIQGEAFVSLGPFSSPSIEVLSLNTTRHYIKYGAKLGWRMDFGQPGGFIFEPSIGYSFMYGFGDSMSRRVVNAVNGDVGDIENLIDMAERFVLVGGPRISLAFGWRF